MHNVFLTFKQFSNVVDKTLESSKYDMLMDRKSNIKIFIDNIVTKVKEAVIEFVNYLLSKISIDLNTNSDKNFSIIILILVLIGIILFIAIIKRLMNKIPKNTLIDEMLIEVNEQKSTIPELINKGKLFASEGKFREAVRYHYIALLWIFNKHNILTFEKSKTNGQILEELITKNFSAVGMFEKVIDIVNITWYGHKLIYHDTFINYINCFEALVAEVKKNEKQHSY